MCAKSKEPDGCCRDGALAALSVFDERTFTMTSHQILQRLPRGRTRHLPATVVLGLAVALALAACTTAPAGGTKSAGLATTSAPRPRSSSPTVPVATVPVATVPVATVPEPTAPSGRGVASTGWELTVYYTAVESFHSGARQNVTGCPNQNCAFGSTALGSYPQSFVGAVRTEGTGRITSGAQTGRYLNWSSNVGYWLDSIPANARGTALIPFVSAAADGGVLEQGSRFRLQAPLRQGGGQVDASFSSLLLGATWLIDDQFTPGLGGAGHLDLYIGEENQANFTSGPRYVAMQDSNIVRL